MIDFSRCRDVWVPPNKHTDEEGHWSPPPSHVKYGVEWLLERPFAMLADDMGGMKTAQAIIAAQFLSEAGVIDRVVVVAPASVRSAVWFDEGLGQLKEQVWLGKRNQVSEYHGNVRAWISEPDGSKELKWIITNYELIRSRKHLNVLLPYCGPKTLLVLDESSAVKGYSSKQTDACMLLRWRARRNRKGNMRPVIGAERCGRVLLLNGTPVADSPRDMFSQGNLMHPSILDCRYITHFEARYGVKEIVRLTSGKPMLNPKTGQPLTTVTSWTNLGDLQSRFAPYVLRREAKDLDIDFALPPVGLEVSLTSKTWSAYCEMRDEMVAWLERGGVAVARHAATKSIRLSQITSGFVGGVEDAETGELIGLREVGREKLDFSLAWHADLLKRHPDLKLLAWCRFVPELRRYLNEEQLMFPSIPIGAACGEKIFDGEHSAKGERDYALRLLHPKTAPIGPATVGGTHGTGALGLNFTACRTVLDVSYDFAPWKKKQSDARVNRPGQTGPISFFYLLAVGPKGQRTIDHHVMMTRLSKTNVNDYTTKAWVKMLTDE